MMKSKFVTIVLIAIASTLDGCATVAQKNTDQCVQALQNATDPAIVAVSDKQPSPDGRTVIIMGQLEDRRSETLKPVKVECTFNHKTFIALRWLEPANFATQR